MYCYSKEKLEVGHWFLKSEKVLLSPYFWTTIVDFFKPKLSITHFNCFKGKMMNNIHVTMISVG